jgi:Tol biopolymer transport system component
VTSGLPQNDEQGSVFHAAWAPDGRRVAFTASWGTGVPHLFVATLQENGVALAPAKVRELRGVRACEVAWSADGERLAITSRDDDPDGPSPCDGGGVVWSLDPDVPATLEAVTDYEDGAGNPVWRPRPRP